MLIIDAIRRSNTAHEVCFLMTNYVETLQFYDSNQCLPAGAATLPVIGLDDIAARYAGLREAQLCDLARSRCNTYGAILGEATEVFYAALSRLKSLSEAEPLAAPRESWRTRHGSNITI